MAEFDTDAILSLLPPRVPVVSWATAPCDRACSVIPNRTSTVRAYVRDVVNCTPPFVGDLTPLMDALFAARTPQPVTAAALVSVLQQHVELFDMYKSVPDFIPRALRALNGADVPLVSAAHVDAAAAREQAMAGLPRGWGVCDPPTYAVAYRLLGSVGADVRVLPKYATLPLAIRGALMAAWTAACARFQWIGFPNPPADVRAESRRGS